MVLSDAVPNLLIGLREGLEAGLVISILLAAVRKSPAAAEAPRPTAPVWLGVLGAITVSASVAAVLSSTTSSFGARGQDILGGLLSVVAVALVSAMIFWMSRTATNLSGELSGKVREALMLGAGALALTAFLAVAREGLETTLFLWTAARAAGESVGPIIGGALGLAIAVLLCWGLYRRSVRMNLKVFFTRTAVLLIVVAAGILAYGIGDLQTAGWLPGRSWYAFDFSGNGWTDSWWVAIITGITQLTPRMTVLQVLGWAGYLAIVLPAFLRSSRHTPVRSTESIAENPSLPWSFSRLIARRPLVIAVAVVLAPVAAAAAVIAVLPRSPRFEATQVTVTASTCAADWSSARPGAQTFTVINKSGKTGEITLVDAANGVVGEIETLGPTTSAPLAATLGAGSYKFTCLLAGQAPTTSPARQITGPPVADTTAAVLRVTESDLKPAMQAYKTYVAGLLVTLADQVHRVHADLGSANLAAARSDWTPAMLTWTRVGAAYGSFSDYGDAIAGLPHGLPGGVNDPGFTGLRRLEYGLWHGQPATQLIAVADRLAGDIAQLRANLADALPAPVDQTKRPHEILEDMLRFQLMGDTDQGAGTEYAETSAAVEATRASLGQFAPLIAARAPKLLPQGNSELDALDAALRATQLNGHWVSLARVAPNQRRAVDAALGQALETLAAVPLLLELPPSR